MKLAYFVVAATAVFGATHETVLKADYAAHVLILPQVYLNGNGPFRMMIDTGNASSLLRTAVARDLGLHPVYAVEQVTAAAVRRVPVALLDEVRVGEAVDRGVEAMIGDVRLPNVDGVLGQSWLARHDYLLDYRNRRLILNSAAPERGVRSALRSQDGRPAIAAEVNGRSQELVLDSGAPVLVLFQRSGLVRNADLLCNGDSIDAQTDSATVRIGNGYRRTLAAAHVSTSHPEPGLLPTREFRSVYVSNRQGFVVLVP